VVLCDDGRAYCSTCRTKLGKKPRVENVARDTRLATKLLVKFKDGKSVQGTTYKIDPVRPGFNLVPHNSPATDEKYIEFSKVKYVALVDSFTGEKVSAPREYQPKGSEVSVTFQDGEVLTGFTLKQYSDKDQRFSVIPEDPRDYRISMIVERSGVTKMSLGRIPKAQEMRKFADNSVKRLILHYYWQHPDLVITIDELADKLERASGAVERELTEFIRDGLIRLVDPNGRQLRFTPSKDPIVRQTVASMAKEIEMLYFRRKAPAGEAAPAPQKPTKPATHWPL
jgi:hypothetical protein